MRRHNTSQPTQNNIRSSTRRIAIAHHGNIVTQKKEDDAWWEAWNHESIYDLWEDCNECLWWSTNPVQTNMKIEREIEIMMMAKDRKEHTRVIINGRSRFMIRGICLLCRRRRARRTTRGTLCILIRDDPKNAQNTVHETFEKTRKQWSEECTGERPWEETYTQ